MKDFDVTVKLRNNHLVERREKLGLSAPQLAEAAGISYHFYLGFECLRIQPFSRYHTGELTTAARRLCDFFGVLPEELWPDAVLRVRCSLARRKLDYDQVALIASDDMRARRLLPDAAVEELEAARAVQAAVARIPDPKNRKVIMERYGLDRQGERTKQEIGEELGLRGDSVGIRERKTIKRLKSANGPLVEDDGDGKTLREIGEGMGVTANRIMQREAKAMRQMRHSMRCAPLRDFMDQPDED